MLDEDTAVASSGPVKLTPISCQCSDFQSMGLPCSHILALGKMKDLTQYCPEVVNQNGPSHTIKQSPTPFPEQPEMMSLSVSSRRKEEEEFWDIMKSFGRQV